MGAFWLTSKLSGYGSWHRHQFLQILSPFVISNTRIGLISATIHRSPVSDSETIHKKKVECSCKHLQNHGFISEAVPVPVRAAEFGPRYFIPWVAFVCLYWEVKPSTSLPHHRVGNVNPLPWVTKALCKRSFITREHGYTKSQSNPGFLPTSLHLLGSWHFKYSAQARAPYPSVSCEAKYLPTSPSLDCTQITLFVLEIPFHGFHSSGKSSVKFQNMLTFLPCYSKKV